MSKRTETMSVRTEPELVEYVTAQCAGVMTHSDFLRQLIIDHRKKERDRWERFRTIFEKAPDLQEKHEVE